MSFSLFDLGTRQQLGTYPHEGDALEAFRAIVPAGANHNLELRSTADTEPIAKSLGLSLLAYGPHTAVLAQLIGVLRDEFNRQVAMGWVEQVAARPQSNIDPNAVKHQWEKHQLRFRDLVENFARRPLRTDATIISRIQELHRERAQVLDLAKRLDRDDSAPPANLGDLSEMLRTAQKQLAT